MLGLLRPLGCTGHSSTRRCLWFHSPVCGVRPGSHHLHLAGLRLAKKVERISRGSIRKFQIGSHTIMAAALIMTEPVTSVG